MHTHAPSMKEEGLQDGCERCAEHAEKPWNTLDTENFQDLVDRTLRNRFGHDQGARPDESPFGEFVSPRSHNEAVAMGNVMTQLERFGAFTQLAPDSVVLYLQERWRLDIGVAR